MGIWRTFRLTVFIFSLLGFITVAVLWERSSRVMEGMFYDGRRATIGVASGIGVLQLARLENEIKVEMIRRGWESKIQSLGFWTSREPVGGRRWFSSLGRSFRWELERKVLADGEAFTHVNVQVPHVVLLAILAPGVLWPLLYWRRWRRRVKRGRCVKCGYDLRASPERCPECGAPHDGLDTTAGEPPAAT